MERTDWWLKFRCVSFQRDGVFPGNRIGFLRGPTSSHGQVSLGSRIAGAGGGSTKRTKALFDFPGSAKGAPQAELAAASYALQFFGSLLMFAGPRLVWWMEVVNLAWMVLGLWVDSRGSDTGLALQGEGQGPD